MRATGTAPTDLRRNDPLRSTQRVDIHRTPDPEAYRLLRAVDDLRDALVAFLATRPDPEPDRRYLSLTAAARRCGVHRTTIARWVDAGTIASIGPKHARRVSVAQLDALDRGTER